MMEPASPSDESLAPRGPWSFVWETSGGGFTRNGLFFILSWVAFQWGVPSLWAVHLRRLAGNSALPHYWGERLNARDIQEMLQNGGLQQAWTGFWMPVFGILAFILILWYGWRLQAEEVHLEARWQPWMLGGVDTALIGLVPLGGLTWLILEALALLGATGIPGLGWLALVGQGLAPLCLGSTLMLQWWICRVARASRPGTPLGQHLLGAFSCLWSSPLQWASLILGGVVVRMGLQGSVLLLAWRWGGGSTLRVWTFLLLQGVAAAVNAWLIAWFLRLVARHGHRDARIRQAVADLKRQFA